MPSRQLPSLATDTGINQLTIAAPLASGEGNWKRHCSGQAQAREEEPVLYLQKLKVLVLILEDTIAAR